MTAAQICSRFDLKKEARLLLTDGMRPRQFVETLMVNRRFLDGLDFVAYSLPPREGVWWGCLCLQHACGETLPPAEFRACRAAVEWVLQPGEESRIAAKAPAEAAGPLSPAGALAMAAAQAGNEIAASNAVARSLKLSSIKGHPAKAADTQRAFVELGMRIAEGRFW